MMLNNLVGRDVTLWRKRYDEALLLNGIPAKYQYPLMADTNNQGESVIDSYSDVQDIFIFFDSNPKIKTFRRYGWVVDNDADLPFLIHCSWNLPHVQKDSLFIFSGQYSEMPDRKFRVVEITYMIDSPDHLVCQVVPAYDEQTVGRTKQEIKKTFNKSNHFIKPNHDYRGNPYETKTEDGVDRGLPTDYRESRF